ncbi:patatin-like phospholipase family protein, partial [Ferruginibacter sp.]
RRAAAPGQAPVELALQGGGAHGAFTWGVLDRLLQDPTLDIAAVSGTSAGALNAAVLATGWARGGKDGGRIAAREALAAFWGEIGGQRGCFGHSLVHPAFGPGAVAGSMLGGPAAVPARGPHPGWAPWPMPGLDAFNLDRNPFYAWFNGLLRLLSPYQFNPLGLDPLREVVQRHVDPRRLADSPLAVYVTVAFFQLSEAKTCHKVEQM